MRNFIFFKNRLQNYMSIYKHFSISTYLKTVPNILFINKNNASFINKNFCLVVIFLYLLVCLLPY